MGSTKIFRGVTEKKSQATVQNRLAHLTKGTPMAWGSGENASKFLSGFSGMKLSVVLTISTNPLQIPGYLDAAHDFVTRFQIVVSKTSSQIVGCPYDFG